jgi:two-component system LytT family response regulator
MIKAIIVDDEQSAIESLQWELNNFCSEVSIIETFTNPIEAVSAINYLKPNVVFLDIEMPELDGFQLLRKLDYSGFDLIITTAYNQYAIQAFKENAVDYLLKPVDPDELIRVMDKVKKNFSDNQLGANVEKIFEKYFIDQNKTTSSRVPLALQDRIIMVNNDDILYCKSEGNYTHVVMKEGKVHLVSKSIKSLFNMMSKKHFLRVHKSYVVNTKYIIEYIRGDGGEILMSNKKNIPVSRAHKTELLESLHIN